MNKTIKVLGCLCLLITNVFCASINMGNNIYTLQNNGWCGNNDQQLNGPTLIAHLQGLGNNLLKEIGRILIAQGGVEAQEGNVAQNNGPNYMDNINDAKRTLFANQTNNLHQHLLINGHLGYFPFIKGLGDVDVFDDGKGPYRKFVKADLLNPRGMFYINPLIMTRVRNSQLIHMAINYLNHGLSLSNVDPVLAPSLYGIDPIGEIHQGSLAMYTRNLILNIFSLNNINNINVAFQWQLLGQVQPADLNQQRIIHIDFTVNNPAQILGFNNNTIGEHFNQQPTNRIKLIVKIDNGILTIVTMYPISPALPLMAPHGN